MVCLSWTASCSTDDFEMAGPASSACIVSAVTMGQIPAVVNLKQTDGTDSLVVINVVGANYPMTIDHFGGRIYNLDSLPYGADVSKVTFTTLSCSGTLGIRSLYQEGDTLFVATDSTDFRNSRLVTVFAMDGVSSRSYNMEVRVHKEDGDAFVWRKVGENLSALQNIEFTGALATNDSIFAFGKSEGAPVVAKASLNDASLWETVALAHEVSAPVNFGEQYYALSQGELMVATDVANWEVVATAPKNILALTATPNALVVTTAEGFYTSADGVAWTAEVADEPQYMPTANVGMAYLTSKTDTSYIELFAIGDASGTPVVWKHNIDLQGGESFVWNYYPAMANNPYPCPELQGRQLFAYDKGLLQTGVDSNGELIFYLSRDGGRTWRNDAIPELDLHAGQVITLVDKAQFVWVLSSEGVACRGRYNRLGWTRQDSES